MICNGAGEVLLDRADDGESCGASVWLVVVSDGKGRSGQSSGAASRGAVNVLLAMLVQQWGG